MTKTMKAISIVLCFLNAICIIFNLLVIMFNVPSVITYVSLVLNILAVYLLGNQLIKAK